MNLPDSILTATSQAPDYSTAFTSRVDVLATAIERELSTAVAHDSDMNYRYGQSLSFICSPPSKHRKGSGLSPIEVRIYVSSRAKLFAVYCLDLKLGYMQPGKRNHPMPLDLMPEDAACHIETCRRVMLTHGYTEVSALIFDEPAPGCFTEMDGLPANTFQALFAEVI